MEDAMDGDVMENVKLIIDVVAGVIPEKPEPEYSRKFFLSSKEWDAVQANMKAELLAEVNGKAQAYAMLLMLQPDRMNWVRTDWLWL